MVPRCSTTWRAVYRRVDAARTAGCRTTSGSRRLPARMESCRRSWSCRVPESRSGCRVYDTSLRSRGSRSCACRPARTRRGSSRCARLRRLEVVVVEVEVQQVDVPRRLDGLVARRPRRWRGRSAASSASSRRGRRGCSPRGSLAYSSSSSRPKSAAVKASPARDAGLRIVVGEPGALVQPLPEDAQPDLAGRHVLHQVEHVVVAEEVGGLERRGLEALAEGVAVLQRDARAGRARRGRCAAPARAASGRRRPPRV